MPTEPSDPRACDTRTVTREASYPVTIDPVSFRPVDLDTIKTVAMWALIAIAVAGILIAIVVKKIVTKIISLLLAAVLVFFCWQQRDKVTEAGDTIKAKACHTTEDDLPSFFGIPISVPDDWCDR